MKPETKEKVIETTIKSTLLIIFMVGVVQFLVFSMAFISWDYSYVEDLSMRGARTGIIMGILLSVLFYFKGEEK